MYCAICHKTEPDVLLLPIKDTINTFICTICDILSEKEVISIIKAHDSSSCTVCRNQIVNENFRNYNLNELTLSRLYRKSQQYAYVKSMEIKIRNEEINAYNKAIIGKDSLIIEQNKVILCKRIQKRLDKLKEEMFNDYIKGKHVKINDNDEGIINFEAVK